MNAPPSKQNQTTTSGYQRGVQWEGEANGEGD